MSPDELTTCAFCPRLCRHVCPVAVGTALEAAIPSNIATALYLAGTGARPADYGVAAAELCLGCGACEAHCKHHRPLPALAREARGDGPRAAPVGEILGEAARVCVLTDGRDWSGAWGRAQGVAVSRLHTVDELGHAAWVGGEDAVLHRVAERLGGRVVVTASGAVEAVARAAGLAVERLATPPAEISFRPCTDGVALDAPHQLACCGRREGFAERSPDHAREVAEENVRRLAGRRVSCADAGCAAFLAEHGADVVGPIDPFVE